MTIPNRTKFTVRKVKYSLCYFTKSWLIAWNCITKLLAPFVFRLCHKRFEAKKQQNVPKERHDINDFQNGQSLGTEDDRPPPSKKTLSRSAKMLMSNP